MLVTRTKHYQRADNDHLYAPRGDGKKGLMQAEGAYTEKAIKFMEYEEGKEEPLI
jgi:hypothetical protein